MKMLLIAILLLTVSYANCQTDSIWIEGDKVCMNKEKAIQFAKMKDSLLYFQEELALKEALLLDCTILVSAGDELIEGIKEECTLLVEVIAKLQDKVGLEQDKRMMKERELKSIMFVNDKVKQERRKFKVQRDILIGTGASLAVTVIVLIIINAL